VVKSEQTTTSREASQRKEEEEEEKQICPAQSISHHAIAQKEIHLAVMACAQKLIANILGYRRQFEEKYFNY
jgi:hypothetical protein